MKNNPCKGDSRRATVAGWCWLAVVVLALLGSYTASGAEQATSHEIQTAVCRVTNRLDGTSNVGSGTLIDKTDDGREGLVLTCAHLFREGTGEIFLSFADGKTHRAKLIDLDPQADLAAIAIANPTGKPADVVLEMSDQTRLYACGYGPRGVYRCAVGLPVGQAASAGQRSLLIGDAVRSGDSGGGVFDQQGRLVAVIWGEAQGVTYASYGGPLRRFLGRVLPRFGQRRAQVVASGCVGGVCPQRPQRPAVIQRPQRQPLIGPPGSGSPPSGRSGASAPSYWPQSGEHSIVVDPRWNALEEKFQKQLDALGEQKQDRLEALSGRSVGRAAGTAAVGLLGLSGPLGWGVVAAASVGGWLVGRRIKKKVRGAGGRRRRRPFRGEGVRQEGVSAVGNDERSGADPKPKTHPDRERQRPEYSGRPEREGAGDEGSFVVADGANHGANEDEATLRDDVETEAAARAAATFRPLERELDEARQLLRLSRLEGRDPLQDAALGRLAIDRLDADADSDRDPAKAAWADALRRELKERFNEIAPTSI